VKLEPATLQGTHVHLVPLPREHVPALWEVARDEELWRWTWASVRTEDDLERYVDAALRTRDAGTALPFATTEAATGRVIGSTRFASIEPPHPRVEIGWTWIGRRWQRTAANTEAKLLMLRHAFETLGCLRVELKTDVLNERSRNAMLRIGAREEGIFRKHGVTESGRVRDTAWYSIVDDEWPAVQARLLGMLARPYPAP
jgi:RimJ/RimL family protein N-acetyltransferase